MEGIVSEAEEVAVDRPRVVNASPARKARRIIWLNDRRGEGPVTEAHKTASYILSGSTFTQFDIGPGLSTDLFGINDAGNLVGNYGSTTLPNQAFVNLAGTTTLITIPGQFDASASGINNFNQVAGDYSTDGGALRHGFFRNSDGTLTFPIDCPGATITVQNGINDRGWIVGRYDFADNIDHGFFLKLPNTFISFDYPGATGTSLNGINRNGLISGRYTDAAGLRHGYIAQVSR